METARGIELLISTVVRISSGNGSPVLVALDGRSGTGKSTLARIVAGQTGAALVSGDDFYSGGALAEWTGRSPEENASRCIDWRRLRRDCLEPLLAGQRAVWNAFDWDKMEGVLPTSSILEPSRIIILDGVYSGRPELSDIVGVSALIRLPDILRRERLGLRERQDFLERWQIVWNEAEEYYFDSILAGKAWSLVMERE